MFIVYDHFSVATIYSVHMGHICWKRYFGIRVYYPIQLQNYGKCNVSLCDHLPLLNIINVSFLNLDVLESVVTIAILDWEERVCVDTTSTVNTPRLEACSQTWRMDHILYKLYVF